MMPGSFLEHRRLLFLVFEQGDGPQYAFGKSWRIGAFFQTQYAFLDSRGEAQEREYLSHPGAGDALAACNGGLIRDFPGVDLPAPLHCLEERRHNLGQPRGSGWLRGPGPRVFRRRYSTHQALSGDYAFQAAHIVVLERAPRPEGDLDRQLIMGRRILAMWRCCVYDPEPGFGRAFGAWVRRKSALGDLARPPTRFSRGLPLGSHPQKR